VHSAGSSDFPASWPWIALVSASLVSAITLPLWRRACLRTGLVDAPSARKAQLEPVPLAGGWAVLTGILLPLVVGWWWARSAAFGAHDDSASGRLMPVVLGGFVAMTWLGWVDDRWELAAGRKFIAQLLVALLLVGAGVRISFFNPPWLAAAVSLLWILTVVNAVNFVDNMNGLCAGLAAIAALYLGARLQATGQDWAAMLSWLGAGAALGFLPWNYPKAKAFLGDAGSHGLGFLLAALSLLAQPGPGENPTLGRIVGPVIILGGPLLDLIWVVLRRVWTGQPVYVADRHHLSHRLVGRGLSAAQAVAVLWALGIGLGALALFLR
jgi:UDP-GlcNAc:undecaprenyl-phosphate GlcNAc-1-phosphate transferase